VLHRPSTIEELQALARELPHVRALGTRHSFNAIADTPYDLVSTEHLNRVVSIDRQAMTVTVEGGISYGKLATELEAEGLALHNLASLPHISVAGACATATHGSGDRNGSLSTAVEGMEIVGPDGTLTKVSDTDSLSAMVVGLGSLGIVSRLTLKVEPTYTVRQYVYERLPLAQLDRHFDEITFAAYSVSLFNDWQGETVNQVWLKYREPTGPPDSLFGATPAPVKRHPLEANPAENCTEQLGIPGPWHERLPHFRMEFTPSNGEELQTEYFVPRLHALEAIHAMYELKDVLAPLLYISEIRTVAADDLWLSPCYRQDGVGIHFTWRQMWPEVSALLPRIEKLLEPFEARPHWGKLFTMAPERVQSFYPRLAEFQALRSERDPEGKFQNEFVRTYIG
jgi:xylitol oxidase